MFWFTLFRNPITLPKNGKQSILINGENGNQPVCNAICNGVKPSSSVRFTLDLRSMSFLAMFSCPIHITKRYQYIHLFNLECFKFMCPKFFFCVNINSHHVKREFLTLDNSNVKRRSFLLICKI